MGWECFVGRRRDNLAAVHRGTYIDENPLGGTYIDGMALVAALAMARVVWPARRFYRQPLVLGGRAGGNGLGVLRGATARQSSRRAPRHVHRRESVGRHVHRRDGVGGGAGDGARSVARAAL